MGLTVLKVVDSHYPTLPDFKDYLDSVTKEDALDSIKTLSQMESEDWFRIGMVLSSYRKSKGDEEFKNLLQYAEQNFQINPRKAYYLISIYDKLVSSNINLEQVSEVGWTKLKEIAQLLTPDNIDYWVDVCKNNTTKQLIALLKSTATTNTVKANAIDGALDSTPENNIVETDTSVKTEELTVDSTVDSTIVEVDKTIVGFISDGEVVSYAKYTGTFIEPTHIFPTDVISSVDTFDINNTNVNVIESVSSIALKLKVYDLNIIINTIADIFPNLKVVVTEAQNATIND